MAQSSNNAYATSMVAVVGQQFCSPYPVDLVITRKILKLTEGNFTVKDVNGNLMFEIKERIQFLHNGRVLCDAQGKPIITLQEKIISAHNRWYAFRGDSKKSKNLLFTAKESSLIQFKTNLDVFLATSSNEGVCDFKVKGSRLVRTSVINGIKSKVILAKMDKKLTAGSVLLGKDKFVVTVYPNVDCAFVVALVLIRDAIENGVVTVGNT